MKQKMQRSRDALSSFLLSAASMSQYSLLSVSIFNFGSLHRRCSRRSSAIEMCQLARKHGDADARRFTAQLDWKHRSTDPTDEYHVCTSNLLNWCNPCRQFNSLSITFSLEFNICPARLYWEQSQSAEYQYFGYLLRLVGSIRAIRSVGFLFENWVSAASWKIF